MKILAGHHGHDSNICYVEEGEIKYWNKLERLTRIKRDSGPPETALLFPEVRISIPLEKLDCTVLGTPYDTVRGVNEPRIFNWKNYFKDKEFIQFPNHHLSHAANAFYGSGFEESYALVIDRNGSLGFDEKGRPIGCQTETLYLCSYPNKFKVIYSNIAWVGITGKYGLISERCGIADLDNGKTMGLAAYGSNKKDISYKLINKNLIAKNFTMFDNIVENSRYRDDILLDMDNSYPNEDIANFIQRETNKNILDIIEEIDFEVCDKLCYTGGHAHNCLTNFNIKQKLGDKIDFYVDPIPDDSACSIGYAKYTWYDKTKSLDKFPMKDIYNCGG